MSQCHRLGIIFLCFVICGAALVTQRTMEMRRLQARPGDLYEVVRQEIQAVREADFPRAYRHISTGFQEKLDIKGFADLVRDHYPDVQHIERVEFGRVAHDGRRAIVQVYFFLPGGEVVPSLYAMIHEEGAWKIDATHVQKRSPGRRLGGLRS